MTGKSRSQGQNRLHQIFAVPLALAVLSGVGLVSALVGDDLWDVLSWLALGLPLAIAALAMARSSALKSSSS